VSAEMKIFVSSTYLDLKEYRDKARRAIEESGNEFVGMETFQSHTHEPTEFCPEKVEECDALVLIVAYRYGNIPDGQKISITQMEYEHALNNKIPVRVYLIDPEHPWPPKLMDENREAIDRFRNLLSKKHTRSFFTTAESLYEKLTLDIKKFPIHPYIAHPYALQENFTGRKQEREMLIDWLKREPHPMLSLIAIGGMGKTALAWYWLMEDIVGSDEQPKKILWWSFYDRESSFERFLKKAIEYFSDDEVDWDKLVSTRDKMDFLYKVLTENRYLLVLDGVERVLRAYYKLGSPYQGDEFKEDEKGNFRSCIELNCGLFFQWLASGNPKTKTLFTSRFYPKELDSLEGCLRRDLKKMTKEDAVQFFNLQGINGIRAEIEMACESVGYHPLYLRLLSGMIRQDPKNPGDIQEWLKYNLINELKGKDGHNILELAYNSLDKKKQVLISKFSAFRNPMGYDAISIFNELGNEEKFDEALIEFVERGMLLRDMINNKFDLHPIVRKYCYERLINKEGVHSKLRGYFATTPTKEKIEFIDDLAPTIELYHHTVGAEEYAEAIKLFKDKFGNLLFIKFGAYQVVIELLRAIIPEDIEELPKFKNAEDEAWILNELAGAYSFLGQSVVSAQLQERVIYIYENITKDKLSLSIALGNRALNQFNTGEFSSAKSNLKQKIRISREIKNESLEAIGYRELGKILAFQGRFKESENEFKIAFKLFTKLEKIQSLSIVFIYRSVRALLMYNSKEALNFAEKARELADVLKVERDLIYAEYLIGAAQLMNENLPESDKHLIDALIRDRKINLVEVEPDILLEFAKLRFKQNLKGEALKLAEEALQIADRCEYRLKQADINIFLAEFYQDAGNLEKAREHGENAKERAECGYKPAKKKAEKLLMDIDSRAKR
jgi:tetratricopeptide (TPR) repeat protein